MYGSRENVKLLPGMFYQLDSSETDTNLLSYLHGLSSAVY